MEQEININKSEVELERWSTFEWNQDTMLSSQTKADLCTMDSSDKTPLCENFTQQRIQKNKEHTYLNNQ